VTDERPALLVSACLLGTACNHEGQHSRRDTVEAFAVTHRVFPICPEVCGGLSTPRPAAERVGDRVTNVHGDDVTDEYARGARAAVDLARAVGAERAVLKARSPSCGSAGVTTEALRQAGIVVTDEEHC
jgi:uncharacterized protein YbbK (DUF523 family)